VPTYSYRCPEDHQSEQVFKMVDVPEHVECSCGRRAVRVWEAPAAIHFRGSGFYSTDVAGKLHRKRRPNPGDDLHTEFDSGAARIADAL
jgi:putative FmdB family regulatory protein